MKIETIEGKKIDVEAKDIYSSYHLINNTHVIFLEDMTKSYTLSDEEMKKLNKSL